MAGYVIATINIKDRDTYDNKYVANFFGPFGKFGGEALVVEEEPDVREGSWLFTRTVVLKFPSVEQARAWYESADYQAIIGHRKAASVGNLIIANEFVMPS